MTCKQNLRKKEITTCNVQNINAVLIIFTHKEQMTLQSAINVLPEDSASRATKRSRNSPVIVTEKPNVLLAKAIAHSYTQYETQDCVSNRKSKNHSYHESIYEPERKISAFWTDNLSQMAYSLEGAVFPPPTTRTRRAHLNCIERQVDP